MFQKLPLILHLMQTSLDGPFPKLEELMMTKEGQTETRLTILDLVLADNVTQKIELGRSVILDQVIEHRLPNWDNLLIKCKVVLV